MRVLARRSTVGELRPGRFKAWDIPYCCECRWHIKAMEHLPLGFLSLASVSVALALWVAARDVDIERGISAFALMLGASAVLCCCMFVFVRAKAHRNCISLTRSVDYLGWHGSCHLFDFASTTYALQFMRANAGKLVNLSPAAMRLLQRHGLSPETSRQSVRTPPEREELSF